MFSRPEKSRLKPGGELEQRHHPPPAGRLARTAAARSRPARAASRSCRRRCARPCPPSRPGSMCRSTPCSAGTGAGPAARRAEQQPLQRAGLIGADAERAGRVAQHDLARRSDRGAHTTTASSPSIRGTPRVPASSADRRRRDHVDQPADVGRGAVVEDERSVSMNGATGLTQSEQRRHRRWWCAGTPLVAGLKKIGVRKNHGSSAAARIGATSRK